MCSHQLGLAAHVTPTNPTSAGGVNSPITVPTQAKEQGARTALHSYFAQFAGCRGCAVAVEQVAPEDAAVFDLRHAVPEVVLPPQYLDLEAVHMPAFDNDSAGESFSGSDNDSHPSFIDDTPVELSTADVVYFDTFVAKVLPITAEKLREQPASPATVAVRKRRRIIVTSSSSSP